MPLSLQTKPDGDAGSAAAIGQSNVWLEADAIRTYYGFGFR